jgi:hypothetical protein
MVKAAGWLSLDRQFDPYLRANTAKSWCGLGCRLRNLMVEYIDLWFLLRQIYERAPHAPGGRRVNMRNVPANL